MITVPHRIFLPDGNYEDTTVEVPDGYFDRTEQALPLTNAELTEILKTMTGE